MTTNALSKWLLGLGLVLAGAGAIGSVAVVMLADAPPAEGNFRYLWITLPAALAGVGMVMTAAMARANRTRAIAALWMLSLCIVPYAWWAIRTVQQQQTTVGTLGGLLLYVVGVPGVILLVWWLQTR
jgi:hypothetical protein